MPAPTPPDAARVLADRYELHVRLGTGGAGTVWRGYDRALDRPVAVKLLHADLADDQAAAARFRTEATAAAKLTHPNAVLVYDLGRDAHDDYLVMELVEGASLADVLLDGPLPGPLAAAVGAMVAGALGVAHGVGIVHRDVKPANVLSTHGGAAKLADFGIARALGEVTSRLTRTGTVLGTARYLAPEQLRDDPIEARADVYALGLTLHETITGRLPFGEGGPIEVASRRLTTSLPPVAELVDGVDPGLSDVIVWATQIDPRERPEDGAALAAALRPYADADATAALAFRVDQAVRRSGGTAPTPPGRPVDDATMAADVLADDGRPAGTAASAGPAEITPRSDRADDATRSPADDGTQVMAGVGSAVRTRTANDGTDAPAAPPETTSAMTSASTSGGGRRGGLLGALVALVLVAAAAVGVYLATSGDEPADPPVADGEPDPPPDEGPDVTGGEGPAELVAADYHNAGEGDPENPGDVGNAIDGNTDTSWSTQGYNSAQFGGLKDGVGLWVELGERTLIDEVVVELETTGGELEIYVGDAPPSPNQSPADWGTLMGEGAFPPDQTRFRYPIPDDREVAAGAVLLWFTELPQFGDDGRHRNGIVEVVVTGREP